MKTVINYASDVSKQRLINVQTTIVARSTLPAHLPRSPPLLEEQHLLRLPATSARNAPWPQQRNYRAAVGTEFLSPYPPYLWDSHGDPHTHGTPEKLALRSLSLSIQLGTLLQEGFRNPHELGAAHCAVMNNYRYQ